jgi:hypothetical protein
VTESGGIMGGYVTSLNFVIRETASGNVLESHRYDAAEIASMTHLESNQVFPNASMEIVPFPFRIANGDAHTETVSVAVTVTDYHGNEHHQTLDVSID